MLLSSDSETKYLISKTPLLSPYKYSEVEIKGMLGFLIDNIHVVSADQQPSL
jgi:hypothetical protein